MIVAIVGITGLVGKKIASLLVDSQFPCQRLLPVASQQSVGRTIQTLPGKEETIISVEDVSSHHPHLIFLACHGDISRKWAPRWSTFAWVIDNSSVFRLQSGIPLVVPEINAHQITPSTPLIANPNCSTAQLVMVLAPLHQRYHLKRVIVSTYQSVSGAGQAGIDQLMWERMHHMCDCDSHQQPTSPFPSSIDLNCVPQCDVFLDNEDTQEERKLQQESVKILQEISISTNASFGISATAVRVPVIQGHGESVNIECHLPFDISEVRHLLHNTSGIKVSPLHVYPTPKEVTDTTEVWVGRIRRDVSQENTLNVWIVADNLLKGAAWNAIQIAQYLMTKCYL